jgi:KDO2-lipid IV(A) lauroyltransferase
MAKPRSRVLDYAVYGAVRILVCIIQALPPALVWRLADGIAWLAYRVNRRHRDVAADNLRHAFPHLNEAQIDLLIRGVYRHFATVVMEMMLMPRKYHRSNVARWVHYARPEYYTQARARHQSSRPLLVVMGHLGNWEAFGYASGLDDFGGAFIARRLDNPYLDAFLNHFRRATGHKLYDKNVDYAKICHGFETGEKFGIVGDQDAGSRGMFVEFFGRPASTHKSIALFALQYSAPIQVFAATRRGAPLEYMLHLEDEILPEDYANQPDAARAITERFTRALERLIRRHPEQYFWLHRRWKSAPPARMKAPRAA